MDASTKNKIDTSAAEAAAPAVAEQFVKVTEKRHRHPVFATMCSLAFLLTIIGIIIFCTQ